MRTTTDDDRLRRLQDARATGHVPADLFTWLLALATPQDLRGSPAERLALRLGAEIFSWMNRRGASGRNLGVARRSLNRALNGENVTIGVVADIADALDLEAHIYFRPRGRGVSGTTFPVERGVTGTTTLLKR